MKKLLSESMIERVSPPATGRIEIHDTRVSGLTLRVTAGGSKTFVVRGRIKGVEAPIRLNISGTAADLDEVREEAQELLKKMRRGIDPREERRAEEAEKERAQGLRWEKVVESFIELHAKPKTRSWKQTESIIERYVTKKWKGRLISEIKRADVATLLDGIEKRSVYQANRVLAAIRKLFNWAVLRGIVDVSPIVLGMRRSGEVSRDRFLTFDEIAIVWRAADRIGQPFGPWVKFLLVQGQRRGETTGARWAAIDTERERLWKLTPAETKAKRAHEVPLSPLGVAILEDQPRITNPDLKTKTGAPRNDTATYVFTTTGNSPISGFCKAKYQLDKSIAAILKEDAVAAGLDPEQAKPFPEFHLHDLRRTMATHMEDALGIPYTLVGSILNHSPNSARGVTAVYTRGGLLYARRRALVAWSRLLTLIVEGGELWQTVAVLVTPETDDDVARTEEFRRLIQADDATWNGYVARLRDNPEDAQKAA